MGRRDLMNAAERATAERRGRWVGATTCVVLKESGGWWWLVMVIVSMVFVGDVGWCGDAKICNNHSCYITQPLVVYKWRNT
ncbi:hypothetical protein K440DRAFT_617688 [Wilcoxina mikolae CBS 423.85]|nr:hypothetical protein K440DRAFT_617688 [Wilcoxina mikolae CBS 423.85]